MFNPCETRLSAMLRGAATLFDLSGTGVVTLPDLLSTDTEMEELRKDFRSLGEDFREMLREDLIRLQ